MKRLCHVVQTRDLSWGVLMCCLLVGAGCASRLERRADPPERGWVDRSVFERPGYEEFRARFDTVQVDEQLAWLIGRGNSGVKVLVFYGAWCSDSKREVPHFLKIMDAARQDPASIRLYALDRTKTSADGLTARYRIERIPTFIFLREEEEIGRIVEKPSTSLEGDIAALLGRKE